MLLAFCGVVIDLIKIQLCAMELQMLVLLTNTYFDHYESQMVHNNLVILVFAIHFLSLSYRGIYASLLVLRWGCCNR